MSYATTEDNVCIHLTESTTTLAPSAATNVSTYDGQTSHSTSSLTPSAATSDSSSDGQTSRDVSWLKRGWDGLVYCIGRVIIAACMIIIISVSHFIRKSTRKTSHVTSSSESEANSTSQDIKTTQTLAIPDATWPKLQPV